MQWTVPQILAELGHLDVQLLSYIERCEMTPGADKKKCKIMRKWVKAQTELITEIMSEMGTQYLGVHENIREEQRSSGVDPEKPIFDQEPRWRPSMN